VPLRAITSPLSAHQKGTGTSESPQDTGAAEMRLCSSTRASAGNGTAKTNILSALSLLVLGQAHHCSSFFAR